MALSISSYRYTAGPSLTLDEIDPAAGAGRAARRGQALNGGAAGRLLAVLELVGRAERPQALAVADRRESAFHRFDLDEIGIHRQGDLVLGARLGRLGGTIIGEQLRLVEAFQPRPGVPEHHLAVGQAVCSERFHRD